MSVYTASYLRFNFLSNRIHLDISCLLTAREIVFIYTVVIISVSVYLWRNFYMEATIFLVRFFTLLSIFVTRIVLLILRNSFLMIFVGWEGLGVSSFLLIVFYQNWTRVNGGLLTLLTNRVGDSVLVLVFAYWLFKKGLFFNFNFLRILTLLLFVVLSFTKRAQAPFTRWLPAAIAAPTPVSALVHSSTLVTAGLWLIVRFLSITWFWAITIVRVFTLTIASLSALRETDGKKLVALSTLRQLGLIFFRLSLGGRVICMFHLVIHAFAKACLFILVGNILFTRFSEQDSRIMRRRVSPGYFLLIVTRVLSLRGVTFFRGFFSKEAVLLTRNKVLNSFLLVFLLIRVISLTIMYCTKLLLALFFKSNFLPLKTFFTPNREAPPFLLALFCVGLGKIVVDNFILFRFLIMFSKAGYYWMFLLLVTVLLYKRSFIKTNFSLLFREQAFLLSKLREPFLIKTKIIINLFLLILESTFTKLIFSKKLFSLSLNQFLFLLVFVLVLVLGLS